MTNPTTFFQVAATLLGTLLISGVLAENRLVADRAKEEKVPLWYGVGLLLVIGSFIVGEILCLDVLVGQPPTQSKHQYVEIALAVCALATSSLALATVAKNRKFASVVFPVAILAVSGAAYAWARDIESSVYSGLAHEGTLAQCPGVAKDSTFVGSVISSPDTAVRASPGIHATDRILHRYSEDCVLGFKGFCLGEPINDTKNTYPDARWFILQGQSGVVASANVRNILVGDGTNDPAQADPVSCEGGKTKFSPLKLNAPRNGALTASSDSAADIPYVGFAVQFPDRTGTYAWHRLTPDLSPDDGISSEIKVANFRRPAMVLATVCLGAEAPSLDPSAASKQVLRSGNRGGAKKSGTSPVNTTEALKHGRVAACSLSA